MSETDLSVTEPDLNVHSFNSQETVVDSLCKSDCLSSQETTDSSELSSPASSTIEASTMELLALEEQVYPKECSSAEDIKPQSSKANRLTKRRIASESDSSQDTKKSKIEIKEGIQSTFHNEIEYVSPIKTVGQLPSCVVLIEKLPKHLSPQISQPTAANSTSPVAQKNSHSEEPPKQLLQDKLEQLSVPKMSILNIADDTSEIEAVNIEQAIESIPTTPKLTRRTTKDKSKKEVPNSKPENSRLKSSAKNPNEKNGKLKVTTKPVAGGKLANDTLETSDIPSKVIQNAEPVIDVKPTSPPSRKNSAKTPIWNPPGK